MEALPRKFGRYRLTALLGTGGQASVFRGESEPVAGVVRNVAIKRLHRQSEDSIRLLVEEARIWVKLQHPNIVTVVDFGEEDGDWFLALELVDGISASALLRQTGPLPIPFALCIAERVARALGHAHSLKDDAGRPTNVVHRDVKPANILLSRQGAVKLSDFGIARGAFRTTTTVAGTVKGSYGYFSPEQARGEDLDGRSDLFSLGCTLFELLTGKLPVPDHRDEALRAVATGRIEKPPASVPLPIRELLAGLLAASRTDRPWSADDVARSIRALMAPGDPDDIAIDLGRTVARALAESAGVTPEDAPSLVPTQRSRDPQPPQEPPPPAEKTRVSKAPGGDAVPPPVNRDKPPADGAAARPKAEQGAKPPADGAAARPKAEQGAKPPADGAAARPKAEQGEKPPASQPGISITRDKTPPAVPAYRSPSKTVPAFVSPPIAKAPLSPPAPPEESRSSAFRDLMLPIAGVAVAIGAVVVAVLPGKAPKSAVITTPAQTATAAPSGTSTSPLLAGLIATPTPDAPARARIDALLRGKPEATGRLEVYSLAKSELDDAGLVFESWSTLTKLPPATLPDERDTSFRLARDLGKEFLSRHASDGRAPFVQAWCDAYDKAAH